MFFKKFVFFLGVFEGELGMSETSSPSVGISVIFELYDYVIDLLSNDAEI